MLSWTFELTDLRGRGFGEIINPDQKRVTLTHTANDTAALRMPFDQQERTLRQMRLVMEGKALLKGYWGASLEFYGPVASAERVHEGDDHSIKLSATSPYWFLTEPGRLVGKTPTGTLFTNQDRGLIFKTLLDTMNTEYETGIRTGTQPHLSTTKTTYTAGPYKPASEALSDLHATLDGFDWRLIPIEYTNGKIADWYASPIIGQRRPNMHFEYGGGKHNIRRASERMDRSTQANYIYHISEFGAGAPGAPVTTQYDGQSIYDYGLREALAQAQLVHPGLRQSLVDEHIRLRRHPRRVVDFQPHNYDPDQPNRVPLFNRDYEIGDWVFAKATDETGTWLEGWMRVFGATFEPDKTGSLQPQIVLVEDGEPPA